MLVLKRKPGEMVYIGEDIVLTVLAVEGERVKLGIAAPLDVKIIRSELAEAKLENENAVTSHVKIEALLPKKRR